MINALVGEIVDARSHGVIDGYVVKPVSASTLLGSRYGAAGKNKQRKKASERTPFVLHSIVSNLPCGILQDIKEFLNKP